MKKSKRRISKTLHIAVEREGTNRYRIESSQLQQIGTQLRGRRPFSVFNSIVLPVIVTILTTLLTASFQYVSWFNSIRLQNATDIADRAVQTYESVAAAIDKRRYATFLFVPTVRDLGNRKPDVETKKANVQLVDATVGGSAALAQTNAGAVKPDAAISMTKLDQDLLKQRFETYYQQIKTWNEMYDKILTDIDYNLDRPIFGQAALQSEPVRVYKQKIDKIDCTQSLTEQLDKHRLPRHSLKLHFAAIQHCFMRLHRTLDKHKDKILNASTAFDASQAKNAHIELGHIYTMGNEFRCYALRRIDYYRAQKERSIISPQLIWRRLFNTRKDEAQRHFRATVERCKPDMRPT